ncbi:MAG: hypothetical protein V4726_23135 [Verrucomicrobiota bacterium]
MSSPPSSPDWMVLQCQTCGSRMKSRRDVTPGSQLLCPKCRAPIFMPGAENGPVNESGSGAERGFGAESTDVEFRPEPLPERQVPSSSGSGSLPGLKDGIIFEGGRIFPSQPRDPLAAASGPHPEFDGSAAPQDRQADGRPGGERRSRIKKRRRAQEVTYVELTDWNQSELGNIPDAEIAADVWGDTQPLPEDVFLSDEREYVVQSEDDGDGHTKTTKKRIRRRRLLMGTRLFFRRITSFSRYFTIALGLLLAGVAAYGFTVLRKSYVAPPLPPVVDAPLDRRVLTEYDVQGAEKAVRDFLAADGVEAKLPYIRQPERVRPLMEKWYRTHPAGPMKAGAISLQQKTGGEIESPGYFIMLAMPVEVPDPLNPGSVMEEMTFFSVEEIRNGSSSTYLVDWETSTGYQEMPLEIFKSTMPAEFHRFRIFVKSGDYYNHGFDELSWQCVEIYYPGRDFHLWGYVKRSSLEGRMLLIKLEAGWSGPLIAELQYPENPVSRDQVIVNRMVHSSWYYADDEEVEK